MATSEQEITAVEVVPYVNATALTAFDRAQMDSQLARAEMRPRNIDKARREMLVLVTSDAEIAAGMHYRLERKKKGGGSNDIVGETIRFAEIVEYCWGNLRVESRVIGRTDTTIIAQGTCIDLERNTGLRVEIERRIVDSNGRLYSDDMITQTGNAAASIARRNAIFGVVPKALWKSVSDAAKKKALGGEGPIEERRARAFKWFARQGKHESAVLDLLGVTSLNAVTDELLQELTQYKNAIADGETTIEEVFTRGEEVTADKPAGSPLDAMVNKL